jgi:hypothetical protein
MSHSTVAGQPVKRCRALSFRLALPFNADGNNALLRVTERTGIRKVREHVDNYWLSRIPADFGEGFYVEKVGCPDSAYYVNLDRAGCSCDCAGFTRWDRCKHVESLLALKAAGGL